MIDSNQPSTRPSPGKWELEAAHTIISFTGRHLGGLSKVRGTFRSYRANIEVAENLSESKAEVWIEAESLDSGFEMRDGHLKSADFLDVEQYPELHFISTGAEQTADDTWDLHGDLTIREVTKPVTLQVEFLGEIDDAHYQTKRAGFRASGQLDREDFGMNWNMPVGLDGLLVGKTATIEIESEALLTPYVDPMSGGDE